MSTKEQQIAAASAAYNAAVTERKQAQQQFNEAKSQLDAASQNIDNPAAIEAARARLKETGSNQQKALNAEYLAENAMINLGAISSPISGSEELTLSNKETFAVTENSTKVSGAGVTQDLKLTQAGVKEAVPEKAKAKATVAIKVPTYRAQPNVLHQYATYSYGISLYVLGKKDYNSLVKNPKSFSPSSAQCLIANAGAHGSSKRRNKYWNDDFYFDGLKMSSIVGFNSSSRGANVIDLNFTIIEPMGFTFIDRLLQTSYDINSSTPGVSQKDAPNYITMPYLLQIEFFGYDDEGNQKNLSALTKYIPIRMLSCKSKVSAKGSEYNITAAPYNHNAFSEHTVSTPCNMEVSAKTVGDFFADNSEDAASITKFNQLQRENAVFNKNDEERQKKLKAAGQTGKVYDDAMSKSKSAKVKSYTGAYNAWEEDLVKNKYKQYPSRIKFNIDGDIADAVFSAGKKTDSKNTPMTNLKSSADVSANAKGNDPKSVNKPNNVDSNTEILAIQAGDSIIHLINKIIINSSYITDQLQDPLSGKNISGDPEELQKASKTPNMPMNWFKIIPEITLGEFDYSKNEWSAIITYHVRKAPYYNDKAPYAPKSLVNGTVKDYNYIYTGLNTDIIDFNIDFDALFYTAITVDRAKFLELNSTDQNGEEDKNTGALQSVNSNSAQPLKIEHKADDKKNNTGTTQETVLRGAASDVAKSVYGATDMVTLNLRIVGDPEFIKQDDLFFNPGSSSYNDESQNIAPGQSLVMDNGEIYSTVKFKTPVDYDDNTGGLRTDSAYKIGVFSGLFRIIKVDSEFRNGKFEQNLEMVRVFQQPEYDVIGKKTQQTSQRSNPISNPVDVKKAVDTQNMDNKSDADIISEARIKAEEESGTAQTQEQFDQSVQDSLDALRDMPDDQVQLREESKDYEEFSYDEYVDGYGD